MRRKMKLTGLYNKKVREELFNNIMADVRSSSAYVSKEHPEKWLSLMDLEDILTVHILRDKPAQGRPHEKERTH